MKLDVKRCWLALILPCTTGLVANAADGDDPVLKALQEVQEIVGQWEGSGKLEGADGWDEKIDVAWRFKKGRKPSLYLTFKDKSEKGSGRLLDEAMITFDPKKKVYVMKAYRAGGDEVLEFEGRRTKAGLQFERTSKDKAGDKLDRFDLKLLNDGDRIVYSFHKRIGKSTRYQSQALVAHDRKGTSLAGAAAKGPKCIVTGGAGVIAVTHNGKTYHVCCTGCRETFLADPEKFVVKAKE